MQYNNLIGESLQDAKDFLDKHGIETVCIETKDRFNEYENKRIVRIKMLSDAKVELLYTGFPDYIE